MPKKVIPLTDAKLRNAKPQAANYTLSDGNNLFLLVTPTGGKLWRLQFVFNGKREKMSLGAYPAVSLVDARNKRVELQKKIADGIDPRAEKKAQKEVQISTPAEVEHSFEAIAREWHKTFSHTWADSHADTILRRLERDVFPWVGGLPAAEITAPQVLACLRRVEARGALETAHRIKTVCGQVFRFAIATGRATRNVAADLQGALPPVLEKHHPALTDPKEVAVLLRAMEEYKGGMITRCALKLAPLLFLRPGELRHAEWGDFNLEKGECNIPIERMKFTKMVKQARKGDSHLIPLSKQAIALLEELKPLTSRSRYVFPSSRSYTRPMSENTVNVALRSMGFDKDTMTGHGFRAMARTILDEILHVRPDLIEHQLGHAVKDALGRAYNRTTHVEGRREMMQTWADYLDQLRLSDTA